MNNRGSAVTTEPLFVFDCDKNVPLTFEALLIQFT